MHNKDIVFNWNNETEITKTLPVQLNHLLKAKKINPLLMQVDIKHFRKPTMLLELMGMYALIVYALATCDLFLAAVQGFYWHSPENNQ